MAEPAQFDLTPLAERLFSMTAEELDVFRTYLGDVREDLKVRIYDALINAHSQVLGMSAEAFLSYATGTALPVPSELSLDELVNDTLRDTLLYHHAGIGNSTGEMSDYIVLRLVTADDIVIVPEEMIDLGGYSADERAEFAKAFAKELRGLADIGTFESVKEVPYGKKAASSVTIAYALQQPVCGTSR